MKPLVQKIFEKGPYSNTKSFFSYLIVRGPFRPNFDYLRVFMKSAV